MDRRCYLATAISDMWNYMKRCRYKAEKEELMTEARRLQAVTLGLRRRQLQQ
jgi:hypothetical protein